MGFGFSSLGMFSFPF